MILLTLLTALSAVAVPPPRPPAEPLPTPAQVRLVLTVSDAHGSRPGVVLQLLRLGLGGRALPMIGRATLARSGSDGSASLDAVLIGPMLVQLSDPERNILVRFPLTGSQTAQVGTEIFRLQIVPTTPNH